MTLAVLASPIHAGEQVRGFAEVGEHDQHQSSRSEKLYELIWSLFREAK